MRWLPVARATSKVFLTMLGIQREDPPAQSQRFDQLLGGRDLVGLLLDRDMPEDELLGMGNRAQYLRRPRVGHGIKAALERLAIDGDTVLGVVTLRGQRRTMRSKRGFHCFGLPPISFEIDSGDLCTMPGESYGVGREAG